jgi:hypothetical protein
MKLLLTSAGINNTSIHNALVELLGKPVSESSALFIPKVWVPMVEETDALLVWGGASDSMINSRRAAAAASSEVRPCNPQHRRH